MKRPPECANACSGAFILLEPRAPHLREAQLSRSPPLKCLK
jgi:hypothetical protein